MKQRTYFTAAEKKAVETGFRKSIRLEKVPGKLDVTNFIQQNPSFSKYPQTKIEFAVYNIIIARKRKADSSFTDH